MLISCRLRRGRERRNHEAGNDAVEEIRYPGVFGIGVWDFFVIPLVSFAHEARTYSLSKVNCVATCSLVSTFYECHYKARSKVPQIVEPTDLESMD